MLSEIFNKVNIQRGTAEEEIKKMMTLFGGKIKRNFSKNTNFFRVGRSAERRSERDKESKQVSGGGVLPTEI